MKLQTSFVKEMTCSPGVGTNRVSSQQASCKTQHGAGGATLAACPVTL